MIYACKQADEYKKKKGEDIIRVKSKKPCTSNTEAQINQRAKFRLVTGFLQAINFLLKIGFKKVAGDLMSPYNYACQFALKNAISGEAPNFEIDYSKVLISDGGLSQVKGAGAVLADGDDFCVYKKSRGGYCAGASGEDHSAGIAPPGHLGE